MKSYEWWDFPGLKCDACNGWRHTNTCDAPVYDIDGIVRDVRVETHKASIKYALERKYGRPSAKVSVTRWHTERIDELLKDVEAQGRRNYEGL